MIIGKHNSSILSEGKSLPPEWIEKVVKVFNEAYYQNAKDDDCFFDAYGFIFEKEFVVAVSYLNSKDSLAAPTTLFISHDLINDSKKLDKALKESIDLAGEIFDDIFINKSESAYIGQWTENEYRSLMFYYKITRENLALTLQAEEILNKGEEI